METENRPDFRFFCVELESVIFVFPRQSYDAIRPRFIRLTLVTIPNVSTKVE